MEISCHLKNILYSIDINYVSDNSNKNGNINLKIVQWKKHFYISYLFLCKITMYSISLISWHKFNEP